MPPDVEARLARLGLTLPEAPSPAAHPSRVGGSGAWSDHFRQAQEAGVASLLPRRDLPRGTGAYTVRPAPSTRSAPRFSPAGLPFT